MDTKCNYRVKLRFTKITFKCYNNKSIALQDATIMVFNGNVWSKGPTKKFHKKITLKHGDKPDLNKAYKILQAMIEKEAYAWGAKESDELLNDLNNRINGFRIFNNCCKHIVEHDSEYIEYLNK